MLRPLFNDQSTLAHLDPTLRHLQTLHRAILHALPASLRSYCHSVYWSEKTLTVNITNSTAMSKIRQLCPSLLQTIQQQGIKADNIKPVMFFVHSKPATAKAQQMTPAALTAFAHLQQSISDPGLKQAVSTLLKAHQPKASKPRKGSME